MMGKFREREAVVNALGLHERLTCTTCPYRVYIFFLSGRGGYNARRVPTRTRRIGPVRRTNVNKNTNHTTT